MSPLSARLNTVSAEAREAYLERAQSSEVILVEGLFDYAVLWQAGFQNVTVRWGPPPTRQFSGSYARADLYM